MGKAKIEHIRKRDGSVVPFSPQKIEGAIYKALAATKAGDGELAASLARRVVEVVAERFAGSVPSVEDVQDIVEEALMTQGYANVAKAYVLYRQQRAYLRRLKQVIGVRDDLKLSVNAIKVLERRYLLRDEEGNIKETPAQLFRRVARTVAAVETNFDPAADVKELEQAFFELMSHLEFLPNTPTLMNAGAPLGQLSACFVLPVEDSIVDIFETLKHMAIIHQSGGGTGFSFSHLRPKGDIVRSTKGVASGPVSFMKIFDAATAVMKQGGKRRGANMGILGAHHPDIVEFVLAKSDGTSLSNFNISVAVTDEFMELASQGRKWPLVNPRTGREVQSINARELLDMIVDNAWRTGDPGLIFLDEINRHNPTPQLGYLEATNPCGELPLLPYESCNLGSINLARMVSDGEIDWQKLGRVVHLAVHFLDNVIEANVFPLPQIEEITRRGNRKIGLGVMGFADALLKMGIPYNSEAGLETAERIIKFISEEARQASAELAARRGVFPNFAGSIHDRPNGPRLRNATVLSIAPTGTISIIAGCSSGIEPLFALAFVRNVMEGTRLLEVNPTFEQVARERGFFSPELMEQVAKQGTLREIGGIPEDVRRVFVTDWDIAPEWHVRMQAVFQKYTDNSVSKTINLPPQATPEDIRRIYTLAHELKCKGITIYRYGSKKQQVLTLAGDMPEATIEPVPYVTADSEYAGGCPYGACPF
ncbi:MAG TPA: adenosylcobalamin-dependent ribonucleoside-diphosphate reductase [Dehalococcoidia bacterium]|jgi:ribonucleoside-diphosphate reductase alpha chain|nr:adenosylcobalamin-dependent ribonucleoside-diphosphate reductase [Dehalococcoidia bacterium]